MADSYVCSGATMKCSMGTGQARLTVLPIRTVFLTGQPMANISDHLSMVNLAPFGRCRSLGFPATASATAANHGVLTPMPCMHNTPFPWMGGKNDYIIKGDPALLKSSTCQCMWGGAISLVTDGQVGEGTQWVSKSQQEEFEEDQVSTEGLTKEDVLDGIQMALDAAGMIPVLGAAPDLLNAAISACRGNWIDAGISLAAAVPGAGDAVGGTKIVKNGVKLASKKSLRGISSLAEKRAAKEIEKRVAKEAEKAKWSNKEIGKIKVYSNAKAANVEFKKAAGQNDNLVIHNSIDSPKGSNRIVASTVENNSQRVVAIRGGRKKYKDTPEWAKSLKKNRR